MNSVVLKIRRSFFAMLLVKQQIHNRSSLLAPLVRKSALNNFLSFMVDRDQTVSRRSKPKSCTTLIGEQPNPWNPLLLQDVISRHRGAKLSRRYGLSRTISLLSLAYLLSVNRWPFHSVSPDHYDRHNVSVRCANLTVKQFYAITLYYLIKTRSKLPLCASVTL